MYCPNCGKGIPDDSQFCPYCGAKIEVFTKEKKNNNKRLLLILIVGAIIILGIFALTKFLPLTTRLLSLSSSWFNKSSSIIWPMFNYNTQHTGQCPYDTSKNKGTLKWKFETDGQIRSSPAIASDGTIYIESWDSYFYAINPNGTLKWK